MSKNNQPDRRMVKDRRIRARLEKASEIADAIAVVVVPQGKRAEQVARVYEAIPKAHRDIAGLTQEHVQLVLDALRQ